MRMRRKQVNLHLESHIADVIQIKKYQTRRSNVRISAVVQADAGRRHPLTESENPNAIALFTG